ncbi:hypothetical protein EW026_g1385 [Hermanssonia centrifuga]|uniref:RNA-dependent RNA polymerase n=1 Tax=Hermanssonia centrifuga TaxID=98765 RepID=A0A4V3XBB5_9APHY|nr:hypothetical protein EW026_g1385 [Hermanssonia centrifuga]
MVIDRSRGQGGTSRSIPPGSPRKAVRHKQAIIEVKTDSEDDIDITTPYTVSVRLPSSKGSSAVISPALKAKGTPKKTAALARASTMPVVASHASQSRLASPPLERSISAADLLSPLSSMALNELPTPSPVQLSSSGFAVIAHDATKQQLMDNYGLSWGTQYEIARGITNGWWAWEDVTGPKMSELKDTNQRSAPKVADVMGRPEYAAGYNYPLWAELDREQAAIIENNSRGLGLQGEWMGESKWYGGRIQQIVHLVKVSNNDKEKSVRYELKLGRMQMGRSHRFARFLGSRRILQIKLPKDYSTDWALMKKYFLQKFVLCGRVYVPFSVKDGKLYSMEINEDYERAVQVGEGDHYRLSLDEFVRWHNPMDLNAKQKVSKWVSRFDLGLSTSVPAIKFEPENITRIGDEYAPFEGNDAPAHAIFTDGCGFMNGSALMAIGRQLGYSERPTAVQGRIFGSKGVWILHPDDRLPDAPPRIWIRASQQKIKLLDTLNEATLRQVHPAHVIFDLLAPSRVSIPARLSRLTIINLAHNKIPKQVLVSLMESGLRAEVAALTQWSGPAAMPLLWSAVNKVSGVSSLRLQRYAAGVQRALGLVRRENDPDDDESESEEDPTTSPDCLIDGKPPSIGETVLEKLQSGFSPLEDHTLFEDIKQVVKNTIESSVKDYHIVVQQSAEAYIVPDPLGVLEEGQIHFKSSQNLEDPLESLHPNNITGEVLIYRNPARVPSDVQKVIAVSHPALAEYVDVIVLPIKGARSLASLLAGGDVDGDVAVCVWDQTLVQSFVQPPITEEPPSFLDRNFEPMEKVLQVAAVLQTIKDLDPMEADVSLRSQLLIGLSDTKVGIYSLYHEKSIYTLGYDHDSSIRTAFMQVVLNTSFSAPY